MTLARVGYKFTNFAINLQVENANNTEITLTNSTYIWQKTNNDVTAIQSGLNCDFKLYNMNAVMFMVWLGKV